MKKILSLVCLVSCMVSKSANACDPCSLYNAARLHGHQGERWSISVSEQFTDFDTVNGQEKIPQEGERTRSYSTTQFSLGYDISEWLGGQLTIPVVARSFDKFEGVRVSDDSEGGIGDIILAGTVTPFKILNSDATLITGLYGGVKLPTGDTGSLSEIEVDSEQHDQDEGGEAHIEEQQQQHFFRHHPVTSGSSGRALSLGSGSFDVPFGASIFTRIGSFLFLSSAQYTIRTEGDFNYEFADDFLWDIGPGFYILPEHSSSLALRLVFSGEEKGSDKRGGKLVEDSKLSNVFVGPQLLFTLNDHWLGEVGGDFLLDHRDSDTIKSDFRVRSGLTYTFLKKAGPGKKGPAERGGGKGLKSSLSKRRLIKATSLAL